MILGFSDKAHSFGYSTLHLSTTQTQAGNVGKSGQRRSPRFAVLTY